MLNEYFHFSCSPFENTFDQRFLYPSRSHKEVIEALLYFVLEKKSFALVCGDVGTGKTMIVHHVLANLPPFIQPILIPYPDAEYIEILRYVSRVLKVNPDGLDVLQLFTRLQSVLEDDKSKGKQVLLILDEAHILSMETLENIRLLSNIELTEHKLIQILLIGQNELAVKLRNNELRQLRQRINVNRAISPMSPAETIQYVDHRLRIAESSYVECFDADCANQIHKLSGGVPRSINRLCDTALLICMNERGRKVTKRILQKAHAIIDEDMILMSGKRGPGAFLHFFSNWKKKLVPAAAAAAAAALIMFFAIGIPGSGEDTIQRLKKATFGNDAQKEATAESAHQQAPASETKSLRHDMPSAANSSLDGRQGPAERSAQSLVSSPPPEARLEGAQAGNIMGKGAAANDRLSQPPDKVAYVPSEPRRAETEKPIEDRNRAPAQPAGELGFKAAVSDAAPHGQTPQPELQGISEFSNVIVQKGENLGVIAARWFPEDPAAGKRAILAANPHIHDENLIVPGQTLRIPKKNQSFVR
jgi:general secretion pathway protein A